jgi:heme exporter protein CcmD
MTMDAFFEYLDMGGYALWVWGAYGLTAAGLIGVLVLTLHTLKSRQHEFDVLKAARRGAP